MTISKTDRRSSIALAILALLYEAPMHPYRMQQLLKSRGKDEVVNVRQRASLYQTIERLLRANLIAVRTTARDEKRPERTIYELTERGRETTLIWMREMLATPAREFPEFPAALAHMALLAPEDARLQLSRRAAALQAELRRVGDQLSSAEATIPRLFLIETEFVRTVLHAELAWVQSVIGDLDAGRLTWDADWLRSVAERLEGEEGA